jgi:hypothetical protein
LGATILHYKSLNPEGGVDLAINDYGVSDKTPHHNLQPNNDVEIKEAGFWKIAVG